MKTISLTKRVVRAKPDGALNVWIMAVLVASASAVQAAPIGGQIVSGTGSISQSGSTTTIHQSSSNLSLNWQGFNIAPQESVNFLQPSTSAVAVNRIFDTNGTQILGQINANGQVYLINPNGILFGQGAQVNVGGLVASTLEFNEETVNGAAKIFGGSGTGSIVNQGILNAASGGYVALVGNHVSNQGLITAQLGTVALGAGSAVTLTFNGSSLVHLQVDQSTLNNLAENHMLLRADGGQVIMTAGAKDALLNSVVNNTGVIEAHTVENHNGTITLLGGMTAGTVIVGGTLDAGAPRGGNGGFIETSAASVKVMNDAKVTTQAAEGKTGTWLVDPQDYTVAATGGDTTGATLSANLGTTSVILQSSSGSSAGAGNVNVNDPVSWSANTVLTLVASNNVNVNANIAATGNTAGLMINPNTANGTEAASGVGKFMLGNGSSITLSGTNPSLSIGGAIYTVINSLGIANSTTGTDLQGMEANLSGHYALGSNIDATATSSWFGGAGFSPIGNSNNGFNGEFNGLGNTITNLTINRPSAAYVGLFGYTGKNSVVQNVSLIGGSVAGGSYVGALVGYNRGLLSNVVVTSDVTGGSSALVQGNGQPGSCGSTDSHDVSAGSYIGGLVGFNGGMIGDNNFSSGNVSGSGSNIGGLVGYNSGTIGNNSFASGNVSSSSANAASSSRMSSGNESEDGSGQHGNAGNTAGSNVGGLVGYNSGSIGNNGFTSGNVDGTGSSIGGVVGYNKGTIGSNSYASGNVTGSGNNVGGMVGFNSGSVGDNSYTSGNVTGSANNVGGLVGYNSGSIGSNSFASGNVTGTGIASTSGSASSSNSRSDHSGSQQHYGDSTDSGDSSDSGRSQGGGSSGNNIGGLVGYNGGSIGTNSFASGNVNGNSYIGGLIGYNTGSVTNGVATGSVAGTGASIVVTKSSSNRSEDDSQYGSCNNSNSGSIGNVVGGSYIGGLIGYNSGAVSNSFAGTATTTVSGSGNYVGGLVGYNSNSGTISTSSATHNSVTGNDFVGGLVGNNSNTNVAWIDSSSTAATSITVTATNGTNVGPQIGYDVVTGTSR